MSDGRSSGDGLHVHRHELDQAVVARVETWSCLLYTSGAADE